MANPLALNAIPDRRKGNGSRSCAFKLGGAGGDGAAEAQRNGGAGLQQAWAVAMQVPVG